MVMTSAGERRLNGWRVLVTRPAGMGDELVARLRRAGAIATAAPLLDILSVEWTGEPPAAIAALDHFDVVIVTSRNAAVHGLPQLSRAWPAWPPTLRWLAIGATTAAELASWRLIAETPADERSEGLLALPALVDAAGRRILLLTGEGGRGLIEDTLRERGATVVRLGVYRRRPSAVARRDLDALHATQGHAAVLVTSTEALHNLLGLAPWLAASGVDVVVASARIADAARAAGVRRVTDAGGADDERMLDALTRLATHREKNR